MMMQHPQDRHQRMLIDKKKKEKRAAVQTQPRRVSNDGEEEI
jgi:hypothetical protein